MKKLILALLIILLGNLSFAQNLTTPRIFVPDQSQEVSLPLNISGSLNNIVDPVWYPGAKVVVEVGISYSVDNKGQYFMPSKTFETTLNAKGEWSISNITVETPEDNTGDNMLQIIISQKYNGRESQQNLYQYKLKRNIILRKFPEQKKIIKKDYKERIPLETTKPAQSPVIKQKVIPKPTIKQNL